MRSTLVPEPCRESARRWLPAARRALTDARRRCELEQLRRHEDAMAALARATGATR